MLPFNLFILHIHSLRKGRNVGSVTGISIIRFFCSCNGYILAGSVLQILFLCSSCSISLCLCLILFGRSEFCIGIGDGGHISGHGLNQVAVLIQFPGFLLGSLIYISINLAVFGLLVIVRNNDTLGSVFLDHFLSIYCNNSSVFQTFFHFGNSDRIPVSLHILIRIGLLRRLPVYFLNSLLKDHDIVLGSLFVIHHIVVILCLLITILIGIGYFKIILGIIVFTLSADNLNIIGSDLLYLGQIVVLHNGNEKLILIFPVQSIVALSQGFLICNIQSTCRRGIHCTLCSLQSLCQCFCICLRCFQFSCCRLSVSICTVYSLLISLFISCHLLCCLFISCLGGIVLPKLCIEISLCLIYGSLYFFICRIGIGDRSSILDILDLSIYLILGSLHGILCFCRSLSCICRCISCLIQFCVGKLIICFCNAKFGICTLHSRLCVLQRRTALHGLILYFDIGIQNSLRQILALRILSFPCHYLVSHFRLHISSTLFCRFYCLVSLFCSCLCLVSNTGFRCHGNVLILIAFRRGALSLCCQCSQRGRCHQHCGNADRHSTNHFFVLTVFSHMIFPLHSIFQQYVQINTAVPPA